MSVHEKLKALNIVLPEVTAPVAAFAPFVRSGNLLFLSGHIAKQGGEPWTGRLGMELSTEQGIAAARSVAIDLLATMNAALLDLNKVQRIVKLVVLVNSATSFTEQHLVANGASNLLLQVFGENGKHARCAVGMASLPTNIAVEIEMLVELIEE